MSIKLNAAYIWFVVCVMHRVPVTSWLGRSPLSNYFHCTGHQLCHWQQASHKCMVTLNVQQYHWCNIRPNVDFQTSFTNRLCSKFPVKLTAAPITPHTCRYTTLSENKQQMVLLTVNHKSTAIYLTCGEIFSVPITTELLLSLPNKMFECRDKGCSVVQFYWPTVYRSSLWYSMSSVCLSSVCRL